VQSIEEFVGDLGQELDPLPGALRLLLLGVDRTRGATAFRYLLKPVLELGQQFPLRSPEDRVGGAADREQESLDQQDLLFGRRLEDEANLGSLDEIGETIPDPVPEQASTQAGGCIGLNQMLLEKEIKLREVLDPISIRSAPVPVQLTMGGLSALSSG
jgi:hypothetical protein